jgi:hypothetical protein
MRAQPSGVLIPDIYVPDWLASLAQQEAQWTSFLSLNKNGGEIVM